MNAQEQTDRALSRWKRISDDAEGYESLDINTRIYSDDPELRYAWRHSRASRRARLMPWIRLIAVLVGAAIVGWIAAVTRWAL